MSSTTNTTAPRLGAWIAWGSVTGLVIGIPLALLLLDYPPALLAALVLVPVALLLAGVFRVRVLAFLASALVVGFLTCVAGVLVWLASFSGDFG